MQNNVFTSFLELLRVKHTKSSAHKHFNEHPHKYNLYGLSAMLSDYGVENAATKIEDKENDLLNIELPFIAHTGSDFAIVHKVEADNVHYFWNGKKITIPVSQFLQSWSGVALLAEVSSDSIEPNYAENRKKELFSVIQKSILAFVGVLIFGLAYINNTLFANLGITLLLLISLFGVYICYLLVLKQMRIHSQYADKICSLFSKQDCNNVLESDAAKLWGVVGWAEIGLGYFTANVLLLLFCPQMVYLVAILNIFTLPYTFWSVWYQKAKARQWCPLCLIVMGILWAVFVINLIFGYIGFDFAWLASGTELQPPATTVMTLKDILLVGSIYIATVFGFNLLIPKLNKGGKMESIKQEINAIKANEEVFEKLLTQQSFYEVSRDDSQIFFGNPDADLKITIFTNPFCNPCAKMHRRVEKLLQETKGNVCVQYLFSSFRPDLDFANKYLIAAYLQKEQSEFERIIADWFERGKPMKEEFFDGLNLDIENPAVEAEFQKHEAWKAKTQLRATPTILVNGYKLPENYKIEDLRYFTGLKS
jgi:protein-disulfide isomerase